MPIARQVRSGQVRTPDLQLGHTPNWDVNKNLIGPAHFPKKFSKCSHNIHLNNYFMLQGTYMYYCLQRFFCLPDSNLVNYAGKYITPFPDRYKDYKCM